MRPLQVCGEWWLRFDHRLSLHHYPEPIFCRQITNRLAVFLHLETNTSGLHSRFFQLHYCSPTSAKRYPIVRKQRLSATLFKPSLQEAVARLLTARTSTQSTNLQHSSLPNQRSSLPFHPVAPACLILYTLKQREEAQWPYEKHRSA